MEEVHFQGGDGEKSAVEILQNEKGCYRSVWEMQTHCNVQRHNTWTCSRKMEDMPALETEVRPGLQQPVPLVILSEGEAWWSSLSLSPAWSPSGGGRVSA